MVIDRHSVVSAEEKSRRAGRQYGRLTTQGNEAESRSDGTIFLTLRSQKIKPEVLKNSSLALPPHRSVVLSFCRSVVPSFRRAVVSLQTIWEP